MAIKRERFCEEKILKLKKHLEYYHNLGESIDYEILVDQFKAVRRTNDPNRFDNYKESVEESTKEMLVRLYTGKSNNCDKVIFERKDGERCPKDAEKML